MSDVLLSAIKKASSDLIQNMDMCDWTVGLVTQIAPLIITIEDKLPIPEEFLILTKNTCDWSVDMTVDHVTEEKSGGGGYAEFASHSHEYKGRKTYLVHNALVVGDQVLLIRKQGGQKFIVLDRVFNPDRGCKDR